MVSADYAGLGHGCQVLACRESIPLPAWSGRPRPWWSRPIRRCLLHVCSDVPVRRGSTRYLPPAMDTGNRTERQMAACTVIARQQFGRRIEQSSGLLICGFGVRVPGGAPNLTCGFITPGHFGSPRHQPV